jgi:predicted RNase H-related nuclease YkuK (DUF458 family)
MSSFWLSSKVLREWISARIERDRILMNQTIDADTLKDETTFIYSIIVSIYSFGGIFGGLTIYFWTKNTGLKKGILYSNVFVFIASFLMG